MDNLNTHPAAFAPSWCKALLPQDLNTHPAAFALSWCKALLPLDLNSFPKRDKCTLTVTQTYRTHVDFKLSFSFFIIYSITQTQEKHNFLPSSMAMGSKHENCTPSHLGDAESGPAVGLTQLVWSTHWHWPGMCVGHWDFQGSLESPKPSGIWEALT